MSKDEVIEFVRKSVKDQRVEYTEHALDRMSERSITVNEVEMVLKTGFNERKKDEYKAEFQAWIYSIRADLSVNRLEKRRLRVPIAIDDGVLIITAIDIDE